MLSRQSQYPATFGHRDIGFPIWFSARNCHRRQHFSWAVFPEMLFMSLSSIVIHMLSVWLVLYIDNLPVTGGFHSQRFRITEFYVSLDKLFNKVPIFQRFEMYLHSYDVTVMNTQIGSFSPRNVYHCFSIFPGNLKAISHGAVFCTDLPRRNKIIG